MNHKYINNKTFEIVDDVFEVDEDIAQTISVLNKKGYHTKYCCSGHVKDTRLYEMYNVKNSEDSKIEFLGYIVNKKIDSYDVLMPYTFTTVYIMFDYDYNFNELPNGFKKKDNAIEKVINYYTNNVKKDMCDIEKEIKNANDILLKWAVSLPSVIR